MVLGITYDTSQNQQQKVNQTIDLTQIYNDYNLELFEPKALTNKWAIGMKVFYKQLERISKEKKNMASPSHNRKYNLFIKQKRKYFSQVSHLEKEEGNI